MLALIIPLLSLDMPVRWIAKLYMSYVAYAQQTGYSNSRGTVHWHDRLPYDKLWLEGIVITSNLKSRCFQVYRQARLKDVNWSGRFKRENRFDSFENERYKNSPRDGCEKMITVKDNQFYFVSFGSVPWLPFSL